MTTSIAVDLHGIDQVAEARRIVANAAANAGFDETGRGAASIIATECAMNVVKHAREGVLLVRAVVRNGRKGLEILALDCGPGMADVGSCMRDGYSTAGSPGTGLGAIQRLSSEFDVYSVQGRGTAVLARLWKREPYAARAAMRELLHIGLVSVAMRGETACGDGWAVRRVGAGELILVVDGLGHGPIAAESAEAAESAFLEAHETDPGEMLEIVHLALRGKRGAAGAVASVEPGARRVRYAGCGNISGQVRTGENTRQMISQAGILGQERRTVREFTYAWSPDSLLLLYSDGLATHVNVEAYAGFSARDPALIAGVLYRDYNRGRDDATVLVAREVPAA